MCQGPSLTAFDVAASSVEAYLLILLLLSLPCDEKLHILETDDLL